MRKLALRWIALALALASFSALSDERTERFASEGADDAFAEAPLRPRAEAHALDETQLDELRAGLLTPAPHEVGVVLWDEPRKTPPPARTLGPDVSPSSVTGALNIQR